MHNIMTNLKNTVQITRKNGVVKATIFENDYNRKRWESTDFR